MSSQDFRSQQRIQKHVTKACGAEASQQIKLAWTIDGRKRFDPPLRPHYFGNVLFYRLTEGRAGGVMHHTPMRIQSATQRFSDEYMHSIIDLIAAQASPALVNGNFMILQTASSVMPTDLCITNQVHFRSYDVDWGWGSLLFFSTTTSIPEGIVVLLPHADGMVSILSFLCFNRTWMLYSQISISILSKNKVHEAITIVLKGSSTMSNSIFIRGIRGL